MKTNHSSLSPRHRRTLLALLKGPISTRQLRDTAGQLNSPDLIYRLRRFGLNISTERFAIQDRDGRTCNPGKYLLAASSRSSALKLLGLEEAPGEADTSPEGRIKTSNDSVKSILTKGDVQ